MSGVQAIGILSLLKTRFERIDGGARQGSDTRQYLRTARSGACRPPQLRPHTTEVVAEPVEAAQMAQVEE